MLRRIFPIGVVFIFFCSTFAGADNVNSKDIQDFVVQISRDVSGFLRQAGASSVAVDPIVRRGDDGDYAFSEVVTGRLVEELSFSGEHFRVLDVTDRDAFFRVTGTWDIENDSVVVTIRMLKMPSGELEFKYTGSIPIKRVPKVYLTAGTPKERSPDKGIRIAVMDFTGSGKWPNLDYLKYGIPESITTVFATQSDIVMVERLQRDKVMKEIDLAESRYSDPDSVVEVGRLLGANYMIVGSYQINGRKLRIMARRIKVESGEIFEAASEIGREEDLFEMEDRLAKTLLTDIQRYR